MVSAMVITWTSKQYLSDAPKHKFFSNSEPENFIYITANKQNAVKLLVSYCKTIIELTLYFPLSMRKHVIDCIIDSIAACDILRG